VTFTEQDVLRDALTSVNVILAGGNHTILKDQLFFETYLKDCFKDSNFFRLNEDPMCNLIWTQKLSSSAPLRIDQLLAVVLKTDKTNDLRTTDDPLRGLKKSQNGGFRCFLEGGYKAYFKPCKNTSSAENYEAEVMSYWYDRITGFYRSPATVFRRFSHSDLRHWAKALQATGERYAQEEMETIIEFCGAEDYVEGALVGWNNLPVVNVVAPKERILFVQDMIQWKESDYETFRKEFDISNSDPDRVILPAMESVVLNMWTILTNYIKVFDHNVFLQASRNGDYGPVYLLDHDRTEVRRNFYFFNYWAITEHPLRKICKFPNQLARRVLQLSPLLDPAFEMEWNLDPNRKTIGSLMKDVSIGLGFDYIDDKDVQVMDSNMRFMALMIRDCIREHGADNVLIREPWTDTNIVNMWTNLPSALKLA